MDRVPWARGHRALRFRGPSRDVGGDEERGLEDPHPRPRVVVARGPGQAGLAHHRYPGRQGAIGPRHRPRRRSHPLRHEALRRGEARGHAAVQQLRVAHPGDRGGPGLRPLRQLRDRGPRHGDGEGRLGAPRPAVQSLAGAGLVAHPLPRPAHRALRRLRPAVRGSPRQEDRAYRVEGGARLRLRYR